MRVLVSDRIDRQGNGAGQYLERISAPLREPSRHPEEHLVIGVLIHVSVVQFRPWAPQNIKIYQ
jgi:hypothetical protein